MDTVLEQYLEKMAAGADEMAAAMRLLAQKRIVAARPTGVLDTIKDLGGSAANLGMKFRTRSTSEALAERLLEGFGKKRKAHEYAKVGRGISRWAGRAGAVSGGLGGGLVGHAIGKGPGALAGAAGGGLLGYGSGRLAGAAAGFASPLALIDTARNLMHMQRVKRLASTLRTAGTVGGVGAAGVGGMAAYNKSKK
jgi:hypothetical protein